MKTPYFYFINESDADRIKNVVLCFKMLIYEEIDDADALLNLLNWMLLIHFGYLIMKCCY